MSLCDFLIHCTLDPGNRIHHLVFPFFKHLHRQGQFGVDGPNHEKSILLEFFYWDVFNGFIIETVVLNGDSSGRLGSAQLPWWVHHDDVESSLAEIKLGLDEVVPVEGLDIGANGDCVATNT